MVVPPPMLSWIQIQGGGGGGVVGADNSHGEQPSRPRPPPAQAATTTTFRSIVLLPMPPKPNLVTYSNLMSRAVSLGKGKPRVALRLWNLMRNQPNFYVNADAHRGLGSRCRSENRAGSSCTD